MLSTPGGGYLAQRFEVCDPLQPVSDREICSLRATHALRSEVLEHVEHPERLLRNAGSVMAPACRAVITVPGGPMIAFDRHIGHRKHYSRVRLRTLLNKAGFEVKKVRELD